MDSYDRLLFNERHFHTEGRQTEDWSNTYILFEIFFALVKHVYDSRTEGAKHLLQKKHYFSCSGLLEKGIDVSDLCKRL